MKVAVQYLKLFGLLLAAYLLFAAGSYWMAQAPVKKHVVKTIERGDLASDQPRAFLPRLQCRMDNYTDALILNQAYTMPSENMVNGIMLLPRLTCEKLPFEELRVAVGIDPAPDSCHVSTATYARYWHGNTFLARYLLFFWDYPTIRLLLYIVSSLLLLWCGALLWQRGGWQPAAAVGIGLACSYAFMMQFSLQLGMVLLIALGGMIALARQGKKKKNGEKGILAIFFIIGSLTAYFDLLTAPMLTLGLPLIVMLALGREERLSVVFKRLGKTSLLWAVGYGATWVSKWILATLLTSENIWADGLHNLSNRSGVLDEYGRWDALTANIDLLPWGFIILGLAVIIVLACRYHFNRQGWRRALPLLVVALIPWLWYLFAANHSYLHNWFTFRSQAVTITALFLAAMQFVDWKKLNTKH